MREQEDGCEAIAWIAAQDWCDGQVAMIGISWGGFNGLQIATRRPLQLRTIITVGSTDDRFATDIHRVGGCLSKDEFDWSSTMMAMNDLPPGPEIVGRRWRAMWRERMEHNRPWALEWLRHQRRDAYWKQGSVCEDLSAIEVPVYAVSGWADNYSESVPRLLAGLGVPRLGLVGPWAHSYPHDAAVGPSIGWLQEAVRWFDHWMKGIDTGMLDEPMYRVWMAGLGAAPDLLPRAARPLGRRGRLALATRIEWRTWHLNPGGRLGESAEAVEPVAIRSPLWVGLGAGEVGRYGDDAEWPGGPARGRRRVAGVRDAAARPTARDPRRPACLAQLLVGQAPGARLRAAQRRGTRRLLHEGDGRPAQPRPPRRPRAPYPAHPRGAHAGHRRDGRHRPRLLRRATGSPSRSPRPTGRSPGPRPSSRRSRSPAGRARSRCPSARRGRRMRDLRPFGAPEAAPDTPSVARRDAARPAPPRRPRAAVGQDGGGLPALDLSQGADRHRRRPAARRASRATRSPTAIRCRRA